MKYIVSDLNENNKKLITIFLNIRSVSKILDEFVHDFFVGEKQYDVLCFAEARLTEAISPFFQLDGYIMYSYPRNCHGEGVVLYINRFYSSTILSDVTLMQSEIECVFANMVVRDEKYILGCVYRSPHSNIQSFLEKYESILSFLRYRFAGYKVVIHGDFNINLLLAERNNLCSKYISLMYSWGLLPTIVRPTRISNTSHTLIDNIWINGNVEFTKSEIIMSNISDHCAIFNVFCRRVPSCSDSYVEISRRKLNAENREQLKSAIINYDFSSIRVYHES